jgi:hypothetical protein
MRRPIAEVDPVDCCHDARIWQLRECSLLSISPSRKLVIEGSFENEQEQDGITSVPRTVIRGQFALPRTLVENPPAGVQVSRSGATSKLQTYRPDALWLLGLQAQLLCSEPLPDPLRLWAAPMRYGCTSAGHGGARANMFRPDPVRLPATWHDGWLGNFHGSHQGAAKGAAKGSGHGVWG